MAYLDLTNELAGTIPGLSSILSATFVNRAWRAIRDERLWSFLVGTGTVVCPAQLTAGTVTVTQFSTTVTFDVAATAALVPFTVLGATPPLTALQFRVNGQSLYRILAITATSPHLIVTIDQPFREGSGAGQRYQVYRAYVQAPVADFLKWSSLDDFQNGYAITKDRLSYSRAVFDRRDPQRQSQGLAYYLGEYQTDPVTGLPIWELWPHSVQGQTFVVEFRRQGPTFLLPGDVAPPIIPDTLIMERAQGWHGYPWAQANRGRFPQLGKTDFVELKLSAQKDYMRDLLIAKRQDDEIALQRVYNRGRLGSGGRQLAGPADARYWQSHPIPF